MMTVSNENIFRVTEPLRVEFTGDRWIPRTKASDVNREADDLRRHRAHYGVIVMVGLVSEKAILPTQLRLCFVCCGLDSVNIDHIIRGYLTVQFRLLLQHGKEKGQIQTQIAKTVEPTESVKSMSNQGQTVGILYLRQH